MGVERRDPAVVDLLLPRAARTGPDRDGTAHGHVARHGGRANVHGWHESFPGGLNAGSCVARHLAVAEAVNRLRPEFEQPSLKDQELTRSGRRAEAAEELSIE